jgi:hypothetical protein
MSKLSKSIRGIFGVLRFSAGNASVFSDRLHFIATISPQEAGRYQ